MVQVVDPVQVLTPPRMLDELSGVLRGEEMQWMVDNLFIGNKLSTGQIVTSDGIRLDMREIKTPIVCFCSHGDNITPPQQALDWILDNYQSVDEIRECGQRIFYTIDPKVGHLAIFVGTKVAAKDHAEFINNMELIDAMPPGLYEIVITREAGHRSLERGRSRRFRSVHRGTRSRRHPRAGLQLARGRARVRSCRTRFRA